MSGPATCITVGKRDDGKRLDHFLHERIPGLSRTRIQQAIRERVSLSWGVKARASTPVRGGGEVRIAHRELNETLLEIDGSGNLVITDINGGLSNDNLTMSSDGTWYTINDPNLNLTTTGIAAGDLVRPHANTVQVRASAVTGGLIVDGLGGDDIEGGSGQLPGGAERATALLSIGLERPAHTLMPIPRRCFSTY